MIVLDMSQQASSCKMCALHLLASSFSKLLWQLVGVAVHACGHILTFATANCAAHVEFKCEDMIPLARHDMVHELESHAPV